MKNFDIENLERKNIYKTPEGFLDGLQEKVLQEVRPFSIDIENLERKNIYKTPIRFFDEVQKNVMQEVTPVIGGKEGKIVKINWVYAAAAAITMFFGITYFVNFNEDGNQTFGNETPIANTENVITVNPEPVNKNQQESEVANQALEQGIEKTPVVKPKTITKPMTISSQNNAGFAIQKTSVPEQNPEVQVDQILSNFSSAELATVGKNAEQDLYLDLYN